jgi:hypothetical protein
MLELLNIIAMALAIRGSSNFVRSDFESGSWQFMIGNTINMTVGLAIGNLWLFLAQAGLMFYTLNLVSENTIVRYRLLAILAVVLMTTLGIQEVQTFEVYDLIDVAATVAAIYGAYAMSKQCWTTMAWMWIVADIGFLYVAIDAHLIGLAIQSSIFIYHGYLRVTNKPIHAIW